MTLAGAGTLSRTPLPVNVYLVRCGIRVTRRRWPA